VIAYTDSKLAELLPVSKLAGFLRLDAPDVAADCLAPSLHVTVRDIMGKSAPTEEADKKAQATEEADKKAQATEEADKKAQATDESALSALEDAMAMVDEFAKAMHHTVETRQRMAREKLIKAQEAEALREEVFGYPSGMHDVCVATNLDCAQLL
jgi:hypothetical protein